QKAMTDPLSVFTDNPKPLPDVPAPVIKHGGDTVGAYKIDPHPQIVIDPKTGNAISVQVKNVSQTPGVTVGNLAVSTRTNAGWQGPITLTSSDVSNPNLALTHDNANTTAAAVVYEAMNAPGTPADKTFN